PVAVDVVPQRIDEEYVADGGVVVGDRRVRGVDALVQQRPHDVVLEGEAALLPTGAGRVELDAVRVGAAGLMRTRVEAEAVVHRIVPPVVEPGVANRDVADRQSGGGASLEL